MKRDKHRLLVASRDDSKPPITVLWVVEYMTVYNGPHWRPMPTEVYSRRADAEMVMGSWLRASPPDVEFHVWPYDRRKNPAT